jgi:hypothetical protein
MKREFNRKGGARSARRVTVRAKNFAGKRGGGDLLRGHAPIFPQAEAAAA